MTLLLLLGGFVLLVAGAEGLVRGAAAVALRMGVAPLVVGLTVVAMGTSSPELVVSVRAALQGNPGIAVGNVVGSNICNIALILGLCAVLRPMKVELSLVRREIPLLIAVTGWGWLALRNDASRLEGLALIAGLAGYLAFTAHTARRSAEGVQPEQLAALVVPATPRRPAVFYLGLVVAGIVALAIGADLFVRGAVQLAELLGVSASVIGLTVVALGTSLPELATSVVATLRGQAGLAVGNVVGSNLFNVLGILGTTAAIHPIGPGGVTALDQAVSMGLAVALLPVLASGAQVSRIEGAFFLVVYAGYMAWSFT